MWWGERRLLFNALLEVCLIHLLLQKSRIGSERKHGKREHDREIHRCELHLWLDPRMRDIRVVSDLLKALGCPADAVLSGEYSHQSRG